MPVPIHEPAWWGSLIWLVGVTLAAFGVAWLSGTRLRISRTWYIPLLLVITAGLTVGYLAWLGLGFREVATGRWGWGVLAAVVAPVLLAKPISRQPVTRHVRGRQLRWELLWEGGVYGTAEGVLLSALPPFIAWQMVHALGWHGSGGAVARWAIPIFAAASVIIIHHLGYWSCRNMILVPITLALSVLTVGYLVTASWVTPALAHIFMHFQVTVHGAEMPPHRRPEPGVVAESPLLRRAA